MGILEKQIANTGGPDRADTSKVMDAERARSSIESIESNLRKRLQALREKIAIYGISADPAISIEIEEIQDYFDGESGEVGNPRGWI